MTGSIDSSQVPSRFSKVVCISFEAESLALAALDNIVLGLSPDEVWSY